MKYYLQFGLLCLFLGILTSCTQQPTSETNHLPASATEVFAPNSFDTTIVSINDSLAATTIYTTYDSFYILIKKLDKNQWIETQRIDLLVSGIDKRAPDVMDINGDGYNDLRVYKMTGARGGNQYYYVYLYDSIKGQFNFLKGSTEMPNLVYNPKKKLIEGLGYTASLHYVWFKVQNDSLVKVSSLDHELRAKGDKYTTYDFHYEYDDTGGHVIVKVDSFKDADEIRPLDVAPRD